MDNKTIARILQEIGDILDIRGEDKFRINAYHNAAISIMNLPQDLREIVERNPKDLEKIPGIGTNMKRHIYNLLTDGYSRELEDIKKSIPQGLLEMLRLRGVGPKKIKLFYTELKIKDLNELKKAAEDGMLATLPGMGEKSQQSILEAIDEHSKFDLKRSLISDALAEAEKYLDYMHNCKDIKRIQYAGSLRRRKETIGDIDLLATVTSDKKIPDVMEYFTKYKEVLKVIAHGATKSAVILESGMQVDLRVVEDESFGAALHYFTGSKEHNIKMRDLAKKNGLKINEYGVFNVNTGEMIVCKKEEDVFKSVKLPYIEPELRNGENEIEYAKTAKNHQMPELIELKDLKGDLHLHSNWSDGKSEIEEIAKTYQQAGFKYIALTDHSSVMGITGGLNLHKIHDQWKEIDRINKKLKDFTILKGCEVDILKDGTLDFSDEVLKQLDIVVISAHMHPNLSEEEQTKRVIRAIENPYSKILGHPSGRLINRRAPMQLDMVKIIDACKANNVAIEINSNPLRLDLTDIYVKMAKDKGVKIVIDSDGHAANQYELLKYGVFVGRRGWLTKKDVLNAQDLEHLLRFWE